MSITRTQIARQLLAEGGVSLEDARMMAPPGEFLAYINPKEADMLRSAGGSGIMTAAGIPSFVDFGAGPGSVSESLSEAAGLSGPSSDNGGEDQEYDNAKMMQAMGLTKGPTITTGEDQEDDNARMMQALGIPPGLNYSGGNNIINAFPTRGPSVKNVLTNAALLKLAKTNPTAYAALQIGGVLKGAVDAFGNPFGKEDNLVLGLSRKEEVELGTLQTQKENEQFLGTLSPEQNQRLEELENKKAEEQQK
jgi:hypothetical protein|tara:strand:- start:88 stop:837 length:750 start_codon:yes stop_codon:yes gene_type:complete